MKVLFDSIGEHSLEVYFEDNVTDEQVLSHLEACVQDNDSWLGLEEAHVCVVSIEGPGRFAISGDEDFVELEMRDVDFPLFQELYGKYVQINDRFETVHIWSKELALKNKGRWIPKKIGNDKYEAEKLHSWNNLS